jgi:hypothetical protein
MAGLLLGVLPSCGVDVDPREVPAGRPSDEQLEAIAGSVAARADGEIAAEGEAVLADDGLARRWVRIDPVEPGRGRGAYLLEGNVGELWLVTFEVDGRTLVWEPTQDGEREIAHAQGHAGGGETIVFAVRDGAPVVLWYEYADGDDVDTRVYAIDGDCRWRCPQLRSYETRDARLRVTGPGRSADELIGR